MALDVHLTKEANEAWGFRLMGGYDYKTPLTVVKVATDSPADRAGMSAGDVVVSINGEDSSTLTHAAAKHVCGDSDQLFMELSRGLYDPVLDDLDPIYETIDQEDFDQPSHPNEVYSLSNGDSLSISCLDLSLSRSITASPFIQTKPYRPFSTEPQSEIPPIEDPIILNPNYHDEFPDFNKNDNLPTSKYKLPISEQYDPDGTKRKKKEVEINITESMTIDETKYDEKMRKEIDLEKIELTASSLVDDSIERAVSVTEEIKKEIEIELRESMTREMDSSSKAELNKTAYGETEEKTKIKFSQKFDNKNSSVKEMTQLVELLDKTTEELVNSTDSKVIKGIEKYDSSSEVQRENKLFTEQRFEENVTTASAENISKVKDKRTSRYETKEAKKESIFENKKVNIDINQKNTQGKFVQSSTKSESQTPASKMSTSRLLAEQRAYTIGLQTIPNIKGNIHSSHHYNLLLKTFFIHLTDVMVALSRFILSEPVFKTESNTLNESSDDSNIKEEISRNKTSSTNSIEVKTNETVEEEIQNETLSKQIVEERNSREEQLFNEEEQILKSKVLSGSKMAQMSEKKSEELIQSMDAVISEFQTKTGIEDEVIKEKRSRSRSRIEEEVLRENDPLEWLDKVDKTSIETSELKRSSKQFSTHAESSQVKRSEFTDEIKETTSKAKEGKNMYIAIVEAHVYTNKDAILEEFMASETASENSLEERNVTIELNENSSESFLQNKKYISECDKYREEIKGTVEITEEVAIKSNEMVQNVEELNENVFSSTCDSKKTLEEVIEESTEIIEPVEEFKEIICLKQDECMKLAKEQLSIEEIEIEQDIILTKPKSKPIYDEESAELKIVKEAIIEVEQPIEVVEETEVVLHKKMEMGDINNSTYTVAKECKIEAGYESQEFVQESLASIQSYKTLSIDESHKSVVESRSATHNQLGLLETSQSKLHKLEIAKEPEDSKDKIDTPTSSSVPTTPLTDEYLFKLEIPLPKNITPVFPDPVTPEDEDPQIVKKKLVPHIETTIESKIYDPPLPTPPPGEKLGSPVYTKPGLMGGASVGRVTKEELKDIERKSSLLASAIDETIKSIEEYTESVGLESRNELQEEINIRTSSQENSSAENSADVIYYNGYSKVENKVYDKTELKMEEDWTKIEEQVENITDIVNIISKETAKGVEIKTKTDQKCGISEEIVEETIEVPGYRMVQFDPNDNNVRELSTPVVNIENENEQVRESTPKMYTTDDGEIIGTHQGIIDGLEEAIVDEEVAKEMGKPGMTEDKIAELISGESEMLREAHVMGLSRVITSHMSRADDDSSVDFKKIKPIIESLKDSEVLKALNDDLTKTKEEKKKEERKWTTFLQKPKRAVPKAKFGYYRHIIQQEDEEEEPYKVKIVKQPKPKVAPDYKQEDFDTGLLPWEERAKNEPVPSPVEPEDPILIPEDVPEFMNAVDPLPENEVPDLEETGIPLPPEKSEEEKIYEIQEEPLEDKQEESEHQDNNLQDIEETVEKTEKNVEEMDQNRLAEQLISSVQRMVDPNATLDQQLSQMRAQLAALAQLPGVIQQSLELVTRQLSHFSHQESVRVTQSQTTSEYHEQVEVAKHNMTNEIQEETAEDLKNETEDSSVDIQDVTEENPKELNRRATEEELARMKEEEQEMLEEQRRLEMQKKEMEQAQLEHESRQLKHRPTPRVGKPKPVFGPLTPQERPMVLPGGRRWRGPKDAYNDQYIAEVLTAQAEIIRGKAKGSSYESYLLPYDERVNFMKYEKPPVSLDHLQKSDVYKFIHNMEQSPMKRVEFLTPVIAEADYREKCRSVSPCQEVMGKEQHQEFPQQVQP